MGFSPRSMLVGVGRSVAQSVRNNGRADPLSVDDMSHLSDRAISNIWRVRFQRWSRQDRHAQWFSAMLNACWEWLKGVPVSHRLGANHSHGLVRRVCIILRHIQTLSPKRPMKPTSKYEPLDLWADPLRVFHFHGASPKRW